MGQWWTWFCQGNGTVKCGTRFCQGNGTVVDEVWPWQRDSGGRGLAEASGQWRTRFGRGDGGEDGTGGVGGDTGRSSHGDRREVGEGREEGGI